MQNNSIISTVPKQRGVYSEVINPDNSIFFGPNSQNGPDQSMSIMLTQKQRLPKAFTLSRKNNLSEKGFKLMPHTTKSQTQFSLNAQLQQQQQSILQGADFTAGNLSTTNMLRRQRLNQSIVTKSMQVMNIFDKKKIEDDKTIDPKVMEPFDPIPGRVPRKVAIDRKKKEYASFDIEQLLQIEGIDFNKQGDQAEWLPLDLFDDNTFDDYQGREWVDRLQDEDGNSRIMIGKGLKYDSEQQKFIWLPIQIESYDQTNQKFQGFWRETNEQVSLHRIYFCLDAEDPRKYAKRVAHAFKQRIYADSIIRYNFIIDNMPLQDLSELDTEQKKRLEALAKTKQLENLETTALIIEVNNDYARTMNKIIFDKFMDENKEQQQEVPLFPNNLQLPPEAEEKEVSYYGMVPLERHFGAKTMYINNFGEINYEDPKDFTEIFKDFCFASLFIKEEVIQALQEIRVECNKVLEMEIFNTDLNSCMVLEEFKHIQESATSQILYHLKGSWISELTKIIKNNFQGVGKGWFNMKETNKITYDFGKLKRFLTVVRLQMQDTILTLVKRCYIGLYDYLLAFVPLEVQIENPNKVKNMYRESDELRNQTQQNGGREDPMNALFLIDLVKTQNDQEFVYSTNPMNFINMIIQTFEKGLEEISKIPDLEPKIVQELHKSMKAETYIRTPMKPRERPITPDMSARPRKFPDENKWIWDLLENLKLQLIEGIKPLDEYLESFNQFKDVLRMDPDEVIRAIEADENNTYDVDKIVEEIQNIKKKEDDLRSKIPLEMHVSFFQIQTNEILGYLCEKYYQLQKNFIEMIAKKARMQTQAITNTFIQIQKRIKEIPQNIEELTELKEYMLNVPMELEKVKIEMNKCFDIYSTLDGFGYRFSKLDLDQKWTIFGSPKDTIELIAKKTKDLEKEKVKFLDEMKLQQNDFKDQVDNLERTILNFNQYSDINQHEEVAQTALNIIKQIKEFQEESRKFNSREGLFEMESTNYEQIINMEKEFLPYQNMWITGNQWYKNQVQWLHGEWDTLDAVQAEKFVEDSIQLLNKAIRSFKDRKIDNICSIAQKIKAEIEEFKPKVPLMVGLRQKGMKERHWQDISNKIGFEVKPTPDFTFTKVLDLGLMKIVDHCVDVGERAAKEFQIENMLFDMKSIWENVNFQFKEYKQSYIVKGYDEIQIILDDHIVNSQNLQFSPFKKPFEQEIIEWNEQLKIMSDVLEEWAKCQGQWMYLQPIFDSPDIAKQLPAETKKFKTVDSTWKHTMNQAKMIVNVRKVCIGEGLLERLQEANKNLEIIQKELNNYLEKKREIFARFYFLSNDDLLEILSQTKEPTAVQPHLKKVFENINEIEFDENKRIKAMMSAEKEKVDFVELVDPKNKNVENWMNELENMMCKSVRAALNNSVLDYPTKKRTEWVISHPGQCILNGSQLVWTNSVEVAYKDGVKGVKAYWDKLDIYLKDLVELVRQKLTKQQMVTINALIVLDVHAKDVVENLWKTNVNDIAAFEWISQLRYYWENDDCFVKCIQTSFPYGYEYLGNTLRLVITPLTDKCYMTLMGALKLNLGGAPAGPAGTGKTESVKDLAKALAKQCVVFNCSDSMDYIMVGKFFKGLASAGAWCCFDEFNRINIEVLSVIAQQLLILFGEKAKGTPAVEFEGSVIKLKPTFCVFITMNPGYAGRTELPDNLKALFRAVAMMVPDYAMIGEIMLYSFGFTEGRKLAKKMVATFKLSSEQLSSQDHYDYGMRAVRSVINAAGLLKAAHPDMDEGQLLLRALRDVNVPKFLKDDLPLFENIMSDLFPGLEKPQVNYGKLLDSIDKKCVEQGLQPAPPFIAKIIQLYDTIQVRHGLMIVGPTGGGKTSNYKVLQAAMSHLHDQGFAKVNVHILNPKSITMGQLYGQFNEQTHEWTDGILAYRVRECCRDQSVDKHWVMFDGPVDAIWIESMNTVLDDNKKLCLNSGQILTLTPQMTMMFEVEDLVVASPATVSRCGMIYMEPDSLGVKPLIESWLSTIPQNVYKFGKISEKLKYMFDSYIEDVLWFLRRNIVEPVTTMNNNLVQSLCRLLMCFFRNYEETEVKKIQEEELQGVEKSIESLFIFCMIWSIGCTGEYEGRIKFDQFLREQVLQLSPNVILPDEGTIYEYEFDLSSKQFLRWSERNKEFQIDQKAQYHEIMIPTQDSTRNSYVIKLLLSNSYHILTPGPTGTGKSLNIANLLTSGLSESFQSISITFSAQTSANQTQDTIDGKMDKRRKGVFGPPIGKKFIIFVDDLNMPKKEEYGAQPPIELIRQYLDHKGWYNRRDLQFMKMEDVIILAAMGPPGGGRTFITNRVVRHFNILGYTELDQNTIQEIFKNLVTFFLKRFSEDIKQNISNVVKTALDVYNQIKLDLLPTPSKSHYTFNLRDIWKVFQGVCSITPKYCTDLKSLLRLFYHENMRVFHDRCTTESDRKYLHKLLIQQFQGYHIKEEDVIDNERIIYGDFLSGREVDVRNYQQVTDLNSLLDKMDNFQEEYNNDSSFVFGGQKKPMKLVMFLDACEHIARIARIIRQPNGNALILGVGGSGRQSLSRMATFITNYKIFQIEVIKNYNMRSWRDDVKKVLLYAGIENKPISFLFCDTQIIKEQMMEDINNILNSGDVTGIYQDKDQEEIMAACKADCLKKQLPPTKMNIFTIYLSRVRKNIHLIIAMSPLGSAFTTRLRMFPSLVNCCTIDWFTEWPEEALINVGKGQLQDYEEDLQLGQNLGTVVEMFKIIHKSVEKTSNKFYEQLRRYNYVTPTSYLELLSTFRNVLSFKKKEVQKSIQRLKSGLDKLEEANKSVEEMRIVLKDMQPQLEKASAETEKMMEKLSVDKADADATQKVVAVEEAQATQQAAEATKLAEEAEAAVADANRQLAETLAEVQKLKKEHLVEIKSLGSPPIAVKVTLGGVVILNMDAIRQNGGQIIMSNVEGQVGGKKEENYFETAKRYLLSDTKQLLDLLMTYDKDAITSATIKKLEEKILNQPEFTFAAVERCSFATKFLYMWVKAMVDYYKVYTETKPLREKLIEMRRIVDEKMGQLRIKKEELAKINAKIQHLEEMFSQKMKQKEELTRKIEECEIKLERAKKLTDGLSEESVRWAQDIQALNNKANLVPAHSIIAAGMIAYSGPFTSNFRQDLEQDWVLNLAQLELEHDTKITMRSFLGEPVKIQQWNISGLPKDDTSIENGIIIEQGRRWPLMIDPQTQANKYIKNMGKDHLEGIEIVKANEATIMKTMELAVQFGRWVLIENVGTDLDPSLEPILQQQVVKQGSGYVIVIGDKPLNYSDQFKLFLTTTMPNPHYPPETFVKVSIINFAITPSGLEEQMLAQIVALENPTLQQKKTEIVKKNAEDQRALIKIEDSILESLSGTGEISEILMDETLINQLQTSKKFAAEINQRVKDSKITEAQIDEARESYRAVAFRASILFFCIVDLASIDPMYQYSLQWFTNLFIMGVEKAPESNELEQRLENLNNYFTYSLYENVCRSLFEKHKLIFSFMLAVKILQGRNEMDEVEWRYFLAGPSGEVHIPQNPTTWISENSWPDIYRQFYGMSQLSSFRGINDHLLQKSDNWKNIFDSTNAQEEPLPDEWNESLNSFQKLIVLKSIRPDKVVQGVQNWISEKIGREFIIVPTFDLSKCYKDSNVVSPLIFVLSQGSDPIADFLKFAEDMEMTKKYDSISLGQGQGPKAERLIKECAQRGYWALLQNCHLAISWMPELERICEGLNENMHQDFRLWLTSMPSGAFPISVLQNGIKITMEPPQGLRANLLRTYKNLTEQELVDCQKPQEFKKLLFGFCLFHAIIQDRRKFGAIGWNIPYEFTNEDLNVCKKQLKMLLDEYQKIPYKVINFLGAEINYGGRVTDDKDVRLIKSILKLYINAESLSDKYHYSESGIYYSIPAGKLEDYIKYIEQLPLNPSPEAFGLHDNAEITNAQNETMNLLATILSCQPRTSAGHGKSREEIIEDIAIMVETKTPELFDIEIIQKSYPTLYEESMNTVLVQELIRYNRLLKVLKESLINLKKGLKGLVVLSEELEKVSNSLYDNQVPNLWADKGFLSLKPLSSWTQDLNDRIQFLQNWIDNGTPKVFWISGFFFPQAFITGMTQNYARKKIIAIDQLQYEYQILDTLTHTEITEKPEDGVYVYGIYLEGASWNHKRHIIDQPIPKELFSDLPLMHIMPTIEKEQGSKIIYQCPMYKVVSRRGTLSTTGHSTNFVMPIELPTKEKEDIWIRAGVAAFLSLRY
ncbi:hypothetical protein ABPG74_009674 [Tetrahymena malaccensis]